MSNALVSLADMDLATKAASLAKQARSRLAQLASVRETANFTHDLKAIRDRVGKLRISKEEAFNAVFPWSMAWLESMRYTGKLLKAMPDLGSGKSDSLSLLGIERKESSRWQRLAEIHDEDIRVWEETMFEARRMPTLSRLMSLWQVDHLVTPPMPEGKYRCIVIDPPWPMSRISREQREWQPGGLDYATMTIEEIKALEMPAADDCHIYLWVTHRFLPSGLECLLAWGFQYQCLLTWIKPTGITPFSWMYNTEHVLFGHRGNLPLATQGLKLSFDAVQDGHSVKPDVFYKRVGDASPGPRIDMFSRRPIAGFDRWGAEASSGI